MQDYAGKYSHPGYGEFTITNINDSLFADFKLKTFYLRHLHYDVFEFLEVTKTGIDTTDPSPLNFITSNSGDISLVRIKMEEALDHPIEFKHKPNIIEVDEVTLERYVGDYELYGTAIKVYIKNKSKLYIFITGQSECEILAIGNHKFAVKTLEGYEVEFIESSNESITELILIQPDGTYKATRK